MKQEQVVDRWISKYALTQGIYPIAGTISSQGYFRVRSNSYYSIIPPRHYHESREEAVVVAEKMREKRLLALKRQISRLEAITF